MDYFYTKSRAFSRASQVTSHSWTNNLQDYTSISQEELFNITTDSYLTLFLLTCSFSCMFWRPSAVPLDVCFCTCVRFPVDVSMGLYPTLEFILHNVNENWFIATRSGMMTSWISCAKGPENDWMRIIIFGYKTCPTHDPHADFEWPARAREICVIRLNLK